MTNDELERKMEFIINQQAQFATDIQQLRESQAQTDQVVARLAHVTLEGFKDVNVKIDALVDSQVKFTDVMHEGFKDVNAKIDALVDSQVKLAESQNRLAEGQAQTDEKLRNLIAVVDRYFSAGRNGQSEG
jgi:hypothetical protein